MSRRNIIRDQDQAHIGEWISVLSTFSGNFKSNLCTFPLALVFDKSKEAVQDRPNVEICGLNIAESAQYALRSQREGARKTLS